MPDIEKVTQLLDWKTLLVENYKELGLDENDLAIILIIDASKKSGQVLITPDQIALKHSLSFKEIDQKLDSLMKRNFISIVDNSKGLETSLQPLIDQLIKLFIKSDATPNKEEEIIYNSIEKSFGRGLTPFEVSVIKSWLDGGESLENIKEAINTATYANKKNINYIDSVLLEWKRRKEMFEEGTTTISDKWRKNIDETIELAKLNWLDD